MGAVSPSLGSEGGSSGEGPISNVDYMRCVTAKRGSLEVSFLRR